MQNVEWNGLFESLCLVGPLTVDRFRQGTAQDHFCGTFGMVWWWQDFVAHVMTGNETWLHHFKPETKRQSMECHQANSVWKKKLKAASSVGKAMATIFWDMEGVYPGGYYAQRNHHHLRCLTIDTCVTFCCSMTMVDLTLVWTVEAVTKIGWTVLPHPPYSPDLAPLDYHLLIELKDGIRGTEFWDDASFVMDAKQWL
jgi:hypothetical protein